MTEQQTTPEAPRATRAPKDPKDEDKRYAAYDTTLLRFVGPVCKSKAEATKAAKDRKVRDFEIREV